MVEDNYGDAKLIKDLLIEFVIDHCLTLETAKNKVALLKYDLILLDLNLPDSYGIETFTEMKKLSDIPIVILSGIDDLEIAKHAVREGAQDYLTKNNLDAHDLSRCIRFAYERHAHVTEQLQTIKLIINHLNNINEKLEAIIQEINPEKLKDIDK